MRARILTLDINAYKREWYWRNREKCLEYRRKYRDSHRLELNAKALQYRYDNIDGVRWKHNQRRHALKDRAIEYLGGACVVCGGSFHRAAMDFHHRDSNQKDIKLNGHTVWENIVDELDKCDLVCANCHRVIHCT